MRLEPICEMEFTYRGNSVYEGPFHYVVPYGTQEASLYAEGDAIFRGGRLNGSGRFINHARRRSDGVNLPSVHGIIRTDDGAFILFVMEGRTPPVEAGKRRLVSAVFFESDDERYKWLNSAVCVLEAELKSSGVTSARVYQCVDEL